MLISVSDIYDKETKQCPTKSRHKDTFSVTKFIEKNMARIKDSRVHLLLLAVVPSCWRKDRTPINLHLVDPTFFQ